MRAWKHRISRFGHLSNYQSTEALPMATGERLKRISATPLSRTNNTPRWPSPPRVGSGARRVRRCLWRGGPVRWPRDLRRMKVGVRVYPKEGCPTSKAGRSPRHSSGSATDQWTRSAGAKSIPSTSQRIPGRRPGRRGGRSAADGRELPREHRLGSPIAIRTEGRIRDLPG